MCNEKPERKDEFFEGAVGLLGKRSEVFYMIAEELISSGFFEDTSKEVHRSLCSCIKANLESNTDIVNGERVTRFIGRLSEELGDDALPYTDLTPLLIQIMKKNLSPEIKLESNQPLSKAILVFLESLELLTDCGAKLFKQNYFEMISYIKQVIQSNGVTHQHITLLRQIALNFTYELSTRIMSRQDTPLDIIWIVLSSLVISYY